MGELDFYCENSGAVGGREGRWVIGSADYNRSKYVLPALRI
jgi:hypothetical protein